MNKTNFNNTLFHYNDNNINVVKILSAFSFSNKLYLYVIEEKMGLNFNSLLVIKNHKVIDYVCDFNKNEFSQKSLPIFNGSFFLKNLKAYHFYHQEFIDDNNDHYTKIYRSDFSIVNNKISYKVDLRIDFKNHLNYDINLKLPNVITYKDKHYMFAVSKKYDTNTATILLFSVSDFINNPRFIKEINIKDIYQSIDNLSVSLVDNNLALIISATFKEKSENDPINSQISFYSLIDDLDYLFEDKTNEIYEVENFSKLDATYNFISPVVYVSNKKSNIIGLISDFTNNNIISCPREVYLNNNKRLSFKPVEDYKLNYIRTYHQKVAYREYYMDDDNYIEIYDDNKLLYKIEFDGFDVILKTVKDNFKEKTFFPVNANKSNIKFYIDESVFELFINDTFAYSEIIHIENKVIVNKKVKDNLLDFLKQK